MWSHVPACALRASSSLEETSSPRNGYRPDRFIVWRHYPPDYVQPVVPREDRIRLGCMSICIPPPRTACSRELYYDKSTTTEEGRTQTE